MGGENNLGKPAYFIVDFRSTSTVTHGTLIIYMLSVEAFTALSMKSNRLLSPYQSLIL